jgi:transcriptional regulator with XRE-family HTH domain
VIDAPPVRRLLPGAALRRYRENLGYVLEDAARVLECDRSKISRIETGQRGIRPKELRELLTEYGVSEQEQGALAAIARTGLRGSLHQGYAAVLPGPYREYLALEQADSDILIYDPQHLPDLLQTPEYLQAAMAAEPPDTTWGNLAGGGRARPASHQLRALTTAGERVVIQVLPSGRRTPSSGPATILRFATLPGLGAVYLPALSGGVCLVGQHDVASYTNAFERLRAAALTPAASAQLMREMTRGTNGA